MAFVFEDVPEADWELYNSFQLKSYDGERQLVAGKYTMWKIDRERNIYFIGLGGGAFEQPETYALIWEGKKIKICLEVRSMVWDNLPKKLHWNICLIKAPKLLESKKDEMISIIKEIAHLDIDEDKFVIDNIANPIYEDVVEC